MPTTDATLIRDSWHPSMPINQTITFCGVGAHHQNGVVKRRIWLITEVSRTLLLHAQHHWPKYITTMLWPFAVKAAILSTSTVSTLIWRANTGK
ncbi:hypothetical protein ACHAXN_000893 [Cyclotella atomus]